MTLATYLEIKSALESNTLTIVHRIYLMNSAMLWLLKETFLLDIIKSDIKSTCNLLSIELQKYELQGKSYTPSLTILRQLNDSFESYFEGSMDMVKSNFNKYYTKYGN